MNVTLLDGPIGTELDARGVPTPLPFWSASAIDDAPGILANIHQDYASAGAVVHTANTFRTRRRTVGPTWREWTNRAVQIARHSVGPSHQVAGSLAPLEDCYRPDRSPGKASYEEHLEMAGQLAQAGCDIILCETFPHGVEAITAVEAAMTTGCPVWIALTAGPDADLLSPIEMRRIAKRCVAAGVSAVLVNCTPASATLRYVDALTDASLGVPVGAYANAGRADEKMGWSADNQSKPFEAAANYLSYAQKWIDRGATIVGGCCGTGPHHITAISQWLDSEGLTKHVG
ncbi:homocysteine S-methyltransferase family protein [Neorhodopirellula pilleata]|uniref:Homocysteine S-methyltransferase n=1 Tax=Neorhodopirellula pilleata TaxID=2714738 RepID=A0A5C6AAT7_9BACT|nr:homocysteine S-methyltransferase family protein [Neorhodopirellula pilleata]TWT96428.1 Homocysteine S-methyltransferase [Neorhodopirellula pilleata]